MKIAVPTVSARVITWLRANPKVLCAIALLGIGSVAAFFLPLGHWVTLFAEWIRALGIAGTLLFVMVFAAAALLSLPASLFAAAAGLVYGVATGATIAFCGAFLAATIGFLLARYVFRERVESLAQRNEKFSAIDRALGRQGWKIVGLLRISPLMPLGLSTYLFGVTSVRFWPYVIASAIGIIPGTLLYAYLGAVGRIGLNGAAHQRSTAEWLLLGGGLVATIIVTAMVSRTAKQALNESANVALS